VAENFLTFGLLFFIEISKAMVLPLPSVLPCRLVVSITGIANSSAGAKTTPSRRGLRPESCVAFSFAVSALLPMGLLPRND
jgi:hypothetical protein